MTLNCTSCCSLVLSTRNPSCNDTNILSRNDLDDSRLVIRASRVLHQQRSPDQTPFEQRREKCLFLQMNVVVAQERADYRTWFIYAPGFIEPSI